jgi:hypothetical protein
VNQEGLDIFLTYYTVLSSSTSNIIRKGAKISFTGIVGNVSSYLDITKSSSLMQIKIDLKFDERDFLLENGDIQNAYMLFFEKSGKHIHNISIDFTTDMYTMGKMRNIHFLLQSIFNGCAKLEYLHVQHKDLIDDHNLHFTSIASTLNYLEFKFCSIEAELLNYLSSGGISELDTLKLKFCTLPLSNRACGCQVRLVHMRNTVINSLYLENIISCEDDIDDSSSVLDFEITTTLPEINVDRFSLDIINNTQQCKAKQQTVVDSHYYQRCE